MLFGYEQAKLFVFHHHISVCKNTIFCYIAEATHCKTCVNCRADSRFAPSQWETALLCNDVSHWLGASLWSALNWKRRKYGGEPDVMFLQSGLVAVTICAWISNHMPSEVWDQITYPLPNFNGCTFGVWEWISNFIPYFIMHVIT